MKLRNIFTAQAAAAALALTLSNAPVAMADEASPPIEPVTSLSQTIELVQQNVAAQQENTPAAQSASSWDVQFNPLLPYAAIGGLGGMAALLSLYAARRRMRGAWLRAGFGAAMTVVLLNPEFLQEEREFLPTEVAVVVDRSASQSLDGRDEATEAMRVALLRELSEMSGVNVRTIEVDGLEGGRATDGTKVFGALDKGLADIPAGRLGAVIVLTDGQVHDVPESDNALIGGAPVHVLVSGHDNEYDRRIILESSPSFGIVGEEMEVSFRVVDEGPVRGAGSDVSVTITGDGQPLATKIVRPGETVDVKFEVPHGGENLIAFEVTPLEGEITDLNNRIVTSVEGIRENLRVLLISGEANDNTRAWRNLLKSDPALDLVHFSLLRTQEDEDKTPINQLSLIPVPVQEIFDRQLENFDLIIFDSYQRHGLLPPVYFDNIARYVEDGGALMVVAGPDYASNRSLYNTPLGRILPAAPTGAITEQPYRAGVTEDGERHPVTRDLEGAPGAEAGEESQTQWGRWFRQIGAHNVSGHVLLSGANDQPLLVLNREEEGRVAMLLSDNAWLWSRGYEGGGPYQDMLRRVSHWLMEEPSLEEEALRVKVENGELVIEQQTMEDESAPVTVRSPSGSVEIVTLEQAEPGLWRATLPAEEIGLYSAEQGDKRSFANAGAGDPRQLSGTI